MKVLFFIGLLVPEPLSKKIQDIKNEFAERYGTRHGLKTLPHLTLKPPFTESVTGIQKIKSRMAEIAGSTASFELQLDGYGHFGKNVIYLRVVTNASLDSLYKKVIKLNSASEKENEKSFQPHVTIAHRDLKPLEFKKAWQEFEQKCFRERFKNESISLLEQRNGRWEVESTYRLNSLAGS